MSKDLRGYQYKLESAQRLARMKKDKAQFQLAKALSALRKQQASLSCVTEDLNAEAQRQGAVPLEEPLSVLQQVSKVAGLEYLLMLHKNKLQQLEVVDMARQVVSEHNHAFTEAYRRQEMFERDRKRSELTYAQERARLAATEADRDWLARMADKKSQ